MSSHQCWERIGSKSGERLYRLWPSYISRWNVVTSLSNCPIDQPKRTHSLWTSLCCQLICLMSSEIFLWHTQNRKEPCKGVLHCCSQSLKKAHILFLFPISFRKCVVMGSLGKGRISLLSALQLAHLVSWVHMEHYSFVILPSTQSVF